MSQIDNPYQAPKTGVPDIQPDVSDVELASILQRVLARIIDHLILSFISLIIVLVIGLITLLVMILAGGFNEQILSDLEAWGVFFDNFEDPFSFNLFNPLMWGAIIVNQGVFLALQGVFLHKYGQTIGKRLLKIAMVDADTHKKVPLPQLFVLRYLIWDIPALTFSLVNWTIRIVDLCFGLRKNRRTLHDMTANTIVIKV